MGSETEKLLKELERQGYDAKRTRKGHYMVKRNGRPVTTLSGTASDNRSWKNAIAQLRRDGFIWPH